MDYTKINFKDRIDSKPTTYLVDGKPTTIVKDNTGVTQEGTLLNANNLNHLENGIIENAKRIEEVFTFGTKRKEELVAILVSKGIQATVKDSWEVLYSKLKDLNTNAQYPKFTIVNKFNNSKDFRYITTSVENGETYIYAGGGFSNNVLDKINAKDGKTVWSINTDAGSVVVNSGGDTLYFADDKSFGCATLNGSIKWKIQDSYKNTSITIGDNFIIFGGLRDVIKVNKNGVKQWTYKTGESDYIVNCFIHNDTIIVVSYKNIVKLNLNGSKINTFKLPDIGNNFANAFLNKNTLYVRTSNKVFQFDMNGSLLRTIAINNVNYFFPTHEGACWNTLDNNIYTHKQQENVILINNLELPSVWCFASTNTSTETKIYVAADKSIIIIDYK